MSTGTSPIQPVLLTDNTNGPVAVKPPSTAAVSADKPLVVTMHPNSAALTVTSNVAGAREGVSTGKISLGGSTAGSLFEMRSTTYTEPAAAAQRSFASSSANDTVAGTGARTVRLTYYDGSGDGPLTEIVTLNGVTSVATVATNIRFIEEIEVVTAGSGGFNAGTISLFVNNAGGGGTIGSIGIGNIVTGVGNNTTLWAHHYVPLGYTTHFSVLVCGIISGGSATNAQFWLRVGYPLVANSADQLVGDLVLAIGAFERTFTFTPQITGFAMVRALCVPGTNNATATCSFDWTESLT